MQRARPTRPISLKVKVEVNQARAVGMESEIRRSPPLHPPVVHLDAAQGARNAGVT